MQVFSPQKTQFQSLKKNNMAKNLFNSIKLTKPKRSKFDLSHDVKLSMDMGDLVPILCMEAVPGDTFNLSCESLLRFAPLVSPVMHRMNVFMHYYFVPNRILWDSWEQWILNEVNAPAFPTLTPTVFQKELADYLGLPITDGTPHTVSAFPFAAYQAVYSEYYRDQNLITSFDYTLTDGANDSNVDLIQLRKRAWMHDYFTSALPFAQKGSAVNIPLGDVVLKEDTPFPGQWLTRDDHDAPGTGAITGDALTGYARSATENENVVYNPQGTLETAPTTITDLRRAFKLQEWLEKNARAGTRYVENILAHFGVKSSDARLQRPEYITGTKSPVVISEVLNTTGESATEGLPQGNMAGHGISVTSGKYGKYFCEEHGYIVGVMSVMPVTAYQQGIPKHFLKTQDAFQYYWPAFAHIGEQEIIQKEIYAASPTPDKVFGYTPRYAEYKYMPSRVAGDFRGSLDYWHLGRIFEEDPNLDSAFIECNPGKRIFAVEDTTNSLYCHVLNKIQAYRPMPFFGSPMM